MTYRYLRGKQEFGGSQTTIFEKQSQQSMKQHLGEIRKSLYTEIDYMGTERKQLSLKNLHDAPEFSKGNDDTINQRKKSLGATTLTFDKTIKTKSRPQSGYYDRRKTKEHLLPRE